MIYFSDFAEDSGPNGYGLVGVSSTPGGITGSTATIDIPYPGGIAAGDIAVVHIQLVETSAPVSYGTLPTGYVEKADQPIGSDGVYHHYLFWKRLDGSESGNFSLSMTGAGANTVRIGMMSVWGGCIGTGDPFDDQVYARSSSANCVSAALTTSESNEIVVNLVATDTLITFTPPAGYTEGYDYNTNFVGGNDCSISMNYKTVATAGAVGTSTTVASGSGRYGVISFGLLPVPVPPVFTVDPSISEPSAPYATGDNLVGDAGTHDGDSETYEWLRDGVAIGGATSLNYTVDAADVGTELTLRVTATNVAGSTQATSDSSGTILTPDTWDNTSITWDEE